MTVISKCHWSTTMHFRGDFLVISSVDSYILCLETPPYVMWLAKNVLLSRQSGRNGTAGEAASVGGKPQ